MKMESTKLVMEKQFYDIGLIVPVQRDDPSDAIPSNLQDNYKTIWHWNESYYNGWKMHLEPPFNGYISIQRRTNDEQWFGIQMRLDFSPESHFL